MKLTLGKLLLDPTAAHARIGELRKHFAAIHHLIGADLRAIDPDDRSFTAIDALFTFGEKLTTGVAIIKETAAKLSVLANSPVDSQPVAPNQQGC